jgi:hypothetical protein
MELMKKLYSILFFSVLILSKPVSAQEESKKPIGIEGTYQIQVLNTRALPLIPSNLEMLIKKERHATEEKFIKLGEQVRLKVLPLSEISKPGFKAVEKVVYIFNSDALSKENNK